MLMINKEYKQKYARLIKSIGEMLFDKQRNVPVRTGVCRVHNTPSQKATYIITTQHEKCLIFKNLYLAY